MSRIASFDIQTRLDSDERDHVACDGSGVVVDTLATPTKWSSPTIPATRIQRPNLPNSPNSYVPTAPTLCYVG
ncbi:DUF7558 family protein [Halobacterium hubeiense]|uniref:DUF7558 family protein n=1 Tax=Halobacterium hubeiense TaxID=1407499 RepID=UPI003C72DACF